MNIRIALICLLAGVSAVLAGCMAAKDSQADGGPIHGSAGVRFQSRDTSRFAPERTNF